MAKAAATQNPLTKSQILANVVAATNLPKKDVAAVLGAFAEEVKKNHGKKGPGVFTALGLVKIEKKSVAARKAEKGVPNPFKPGELMDRPAKPAFCKVKVRALKALKDMVK
ncbi:MAG: HU family DNA-binding protein [Planctomycetota bacterium]|nr:HU family DNA-binding protein [Planctomycetota bacterium]